MLRNWGAIALASSLFFSSVVGASAASGADEGALAPGKAAGVHEAQMHGHALLWLFGIAVVAGGLAFVISGNNNGHASSTTTSTTP